MNKGVGYLLAIIGLLGLALSLKQVQALLSIALSASLSTTLLIIAIILFIAGIFAIRQSSAQQAEVPIYDAKNNIVGYRKVE